MKKFFTLASLLFVIVAKAQVGIGTPSPKEDAILEILSSNKGVLIPRIGIADNTALLQGSAAHEESLLIYNTSTSAESVAADKKVTPGFYYWKDEKWHRIINDTDLQAALNGNTANETKIQKILALLNSAYASNNLGDDNGANNASQGGVIFNAGSGTIGQDGYVPPSLSILHADGNGGYTNTEISAAQLSEIFRGSNVVTTLTKQRNEEEKTISYVYKNEQNEEVSIDITTDVITSIGENSPLQKAILKVLDEAGNVYFTATEIPAVTTGENQYAAIPVNSFYKVDPVTGVKTKITVPIDIEQFIAALTNATDEQKQIIRNHLGTNFTSVVNTGNVWSDGKNIYKGIYAAHIQRKSANVISNTSDTDYTEIALTSAGITTIGNVIKITVLDNNGNQITSAVTDVSTTSTGVKFRIGTGNMYNILFPDATAATPVKLLVEFSAS